MGDDEIDDAEKALKKWVVRLVVGGIVAGGTVGQLGLFRVDGFTSKDSQLMKYEVIQECKNYTDARLEASGHSHMAPPVWTRTRIVTMERFLQKQYPEYHPPSTDW